MNEEHICPKCGRSTWPEARYCEYCGAELQRGRAAPITVQRKPSTILLAFTVVLLTLVGVYIYISLGGPLPSSLTREVPVTTVVTKEVVVERLITPVCPTPEVIVKEVPVERTVVETVVVVKEVPVEKKVVEIIVVEKEVPIVVEKEVIVEKEVVVTVVVIKEVPVTPSP